MNQFALFFLGVLLQGPGTQADEPTYLGRPVSFWINRLTEGDITSRREACRGFAWMGPKAAPAVPALIQALKDEELYEEHCPGWRSEDENGFSVYKRHDFSGLRDSGFGLRSDNPAAEALARIGTSVLQPLIEGLKDRQPLIRSGCAQALAMIGRDAEEAVPALIELVRKLNEKEALQTAFARGQKLTDAELAKLDFGEADSSGWWAGVALAHIGPAAAGVVPELVKHLDRSSLDREWAAMILGRIGPEARAAIPALLKAARHDGVPWNWMESESYETVRKALWRIGPDAIPALREALRNKDCEMRRVAAETLQYFGAEAKPALEELIPAASDEYCRVRIPAIFALGEIGPAAKPAVPAIIAALQKVEPGDRERLIRALRKIDPRAQLSDDDER